MITVSHHHQVGNLILLLPCYYQPDFDCFVTKVGNPLPDGAVLFINDFQFKYHDASNCFVAYTGIPVPTLYQAQPADFDILLNYFPTEHPNHPRKAALNPFSLVKSPVSAQLNGPSLSNSPLLTYPTVNHFLNVAKDNTNLTTFAVWSIPNAEQHSTHSSASSASIPSHQQDSHTPILQCTLSNSKCQASGQTGLSNLFNNTYEEHRLWASSVMNETTKKILLKEL